MIRLLDVTKLAFTKLRTRKIRHTVAIIISSVLFVGISSVLFLSRGTISSIESYMEKGLASRYLVEATQVVIDNTSINKEIISRAKEIQKDFIKQKTDEAKKLGLEYDPKTEQAVSATYNEGSTDIEYLTDFNYQPTVQAVQEYFKKNPVNGEDILKKLAKDYEVLSVYRKQLLSGSTAANYLQIIEGGKEKYDVGSTSGFSESDPLENFSRNYALISSELLKPFLLPEQNLEIGSNGSIPILIPYVAAQKLLGLNDLDKNANTKSKAEYLTELREKSAGLTFDVCYRNQTSENLLAEAISESRIYNLNKDKKDYVKPDLVRDLPKDNCGNLTIIRDVRTKEQKDLESKQLTFDQKFVLEPPEQVLLKYRVVGLLPSSDTTAFSLQQLFQTILSSYIGNGWFTPIEISDKQTVLGKILNKAYTEQPPQYIVEVRDVNGAKNFITEKSCTPDYDSPTDPLSKCKNDGKIYSLSPFGGNAIAFAEFKTNFYIFFRYLILGLATLAAIILLGVVSRVIADTRRETAVFRAIGAKRLDIAQIYVLYVLMIAVIISALSLVSSFMIGQYLQSRYAPEMGLASSIVFNVPITDKVTFLVYKIIVSDLVLVLVTIVASCLISVVLPLFANVRRNPINDMRDER